MGCGRARRPAPGLQPDGGARGPCADVGDQPLATAEAGGRGRGSRDTWSASFDAWSASFDAWSASRDTWSTGWSAWSTVPGS